MAYRMVAISGTGNGEEFIRRAVAHDIAAQLEYTDRSLVEACRHTVGRQLAEGAGGGSGVGEDGATVLAVNTTGMYRGAAESGGDRLVAIWTDPLTIP